MWKRFLIAFIVLLVIFGSIFGFKAYMASKLKQAQMMHGTPKVYVSVAYSRLENYQPYLESIGNVVSIDSVNATTQVSGQIEKIYFDSGESVKKGQILAKLDDSTQKAQLEQYKAQLILDEFNYTQYKQLYEKNASSKASYIQSLSALKQTQALIAQTQSIIDKMTIKAPFSGILGMRYVSVGQYVNPGQPIVSLYTIDPIYVDFTLPQNDLGNIGVGQKIEIHTDSDPNKTIIGKIKTISININNISRNATIRAIVNNKDNLLKPGMFVKVNIILPKIPNVVVVPALAITYNPYGDFVYVVTKKGNEYIANTVYVKTGQTQNNKVVILKGLKSGQMVVTQGQLKLRNGSSVIIESIDKDY
ncbi:MAG: efflux RND transporter periplasmic adaptor subunit [Desulfurella sp.]|uniref:efflux RND transporter periplasmic adaptor subunit n=1 Tax=Desulfurella sp. TaxID=1962857 RepID=UPI003D11C0FB